MRSEFLTWLLLAGVLGLGLLPAPVTPTCRVTYVYDGDTVELTCSDRPEPFRARLTGFDTPETRRAGCEAEEALGLRATDRLRDLVSNAAQQGATTGRPDRYGRVLTELVLDGQDVGALLIAEGLALPYDGGSRVDWCAYLADRTRP